MEVDKRTSNFEYLIDAKLKVKANEWGFMPGVLR